MSNDKFVPNVIRIPAAVVRFLRIYKAEARTNKGQVKMRKEKDGTLVPDTRYSLTAILDPTNQVHAKVIEEVKAEATRALNHRYGSQDKWPKRNPETGLGGLIYCFGLGNNMQKVYDGFKDMWYIKLSDKERPSIKNRAGGVVVEGEKEAPYDGAICNVSCTLWTYDNESRGLNGNLRAIQFVNDGKAYSRGRNADDDFATPVEGAKTPAASAAGAPVRDPFDE